ncbi:MAG: DUF1553 domain-containing protein [Verrucomicrobiales bacterium]|nr:DUF1553 domain-containing protein [Verrucomicrobiales bacterium]
MRAALFISLSLSASSLVAEPLDFNRDVRPILSDKCFKCHGPDAKNQKSDFRIDTFAHATEDLGDYAGVVPGDLKASETHWRIHSDDPIDMMPPPESKMTLTKRQIEILDQWMLEGAEYDEHWSFVSVPEKIEVPKTDSDWVRNDIDRFILAELEKENFTPAPETGREKWLRRVTFDLTGLPPTIAELDAFLADQTEDAFENVVARLFDSDAYAERLTGEWMDVARYSDSYGFQVDRDRTVWPWRDWVIDSFRDNMPYDEFITLQVAGDLLPNATRDQILATTFNRLHPQKVEGGSVPEEFRIEYVSDRIHTYGTAFLGLTMECSRCHDHKYDPITAKDYFQLTAFFDNIDEAGLYSYFTPAVPTPTLWLPDDKQSKSLTRLKNDISTAEAELDQATKAADEAFAQWLAGNATLAAPSPLAAYDFEDENPTALANSVKDGKPAKSNTNNELVPGKHGKAIKLTGDDAVTLPVGNFTRDDTFSISLWIQASEAHERAVIFSRSKAWTDAASRGYELLIEDGKLSAALIHFYPGNAMRVRSKDPLPVNEWKHVTMTYDGSSRAEGLKLYLDGEKIETETVRDKLNREITGGGSDTLVIGQRMRDNGFKNGLVDDFRVFPRELAPAEIALLSGNSSAKPDKYTFLITAYEGFQARLETLTSLRRQRSELVKKIPEIMVMKETPEPHQTYLLDRGHYENRAEPVSADTPHFLPPMPEGTPRNRLGLAQWTVSPENPLTARVTVNRYWQMLFGRGLVSTSEDFGAQGQLPTHPELLDWLARRFIDSGWDLQDLLKTIVLSATYRQSSDIASGELTERDPENTLLYRYPAPRLSAEAIRDNALAASGLLVNKVGGPSVKPYDIAVSFKPSDPGKGNDLYRRSLYTYWKQTAPAPLMTTLNASKRDVCRVRLEKTDSPLQGLVLLNSPQFVEGARTLAATLVKKHTNNNAALIEEAFRRLTSRRPDTEESDLLTQLLVEQSDHFTAHPEEAKKLIAIGDSPAVNGENSPRIAAVTALVSTLMNFDECITKR